MYGKHGKEEILIKMSLYETPNITTGLDAIVVDIVEEVPIFIPMFLFFIFGVIFIGGVISQKKRSGRSDVPMWAVISSTSVLMISMILTLTAGLIQMETLVIVIVVTIFSGLWFFLDKNRYEM